MQNVFPLRPMQLNEAPPLGSHKVLEVFHYLLPPDEHGEALVIMSPPEQLRGLHASDYAQLIEKAQVAAQRRGVWLAQNPARYLWLVVMLGCRCVCLYVMFSVVTPDGDWRN